MNDFCANLRQGEVKQVMRIARLERQTQVGSGAAGTLGQTSAIRMRVD